MTAIIRSAMPDDASAIARLYRQLVDDARINVTPARVAQIAACPHNHLLVGIIGENLVATAFMTLCLDPMYDRQPYAVVENVVVDNACRGSGLGAALLKVIDALGLEADCSKIMLLSSAHRDDAHRFFERQGYRRHAKTGFVKYRRDLVGSHNERPSNG